MPLMPKGLMPTPIVIGAAAASDALNFSQNLITTQNLDGLSGILAADSWAFDVTEGLGTIITSSTIYLIRQGAPTADCAVEAYFKSPDAGALANMGVMGRVIGLSTGQTNYYTARYNAGNFRISKFVNSATVTNLVASAQTINIDDICRLKLTLTGTSLTAEFENITAVSGTIPLSTTDSDLTLPGWTGFRTGTTVSKVWYRSISAIAT